nr:NO-inducible flavohemoprotein [Salsuginibacillus halophilus]
MSFQSQLDEKTKETIKATAPVLAEHGTTITTHFYKRMLSAHPELNHVFNPTHQVKGKQPAALANALYAAATHIDDLSAIAPAVRTIAEKHRSLQITPDQYPIVGEHLLASIQEVLGEAATDDIIAAWGQAYEEIAEIFIKVEAELYAETAAQTGGWNGFRNFTVTSKEKESELITSFYLKPADGEPFPDFQPGQYITIKANIEGETYTQMRQYSLSDAPSANHYRISVKREPSGTETPSGKVSNWLHDAISEGDELPVTAPAGDFMLDTSGNEPLVFLSAGVGATPIVSMFKTAQQKAPERSIYYIHTASSASVHGLAQDMEPVSANAVTHIRYTNPAPGDEQTPFFDAAGRIDFEYLQATVPKDASFYFCGPEGFIYTVLDALNKWDVAEDRINYEFFGPKSN